MIQWHKWDTQNSDNAFKRDVDGGRQFSHLPKGQPQVIRHPDGSSLYFATIYGFSKKTAVYEVHVFQINETHITFNILKAFIT